MVGAVIAFYFGKEQYVTATNGAKELANICSDHLREVRAFDKMIGMSDLYALDYAPEKIVLTEALKALEGSGRGDRLPVLMHRIPKHVTHRSTIDRHIAHVASKGGGDIAKLTLKDLLDNAVECGLKKYTARSFAVVSRRATPAEARKATEAIRHCQDVVVTENGSDNEPMLGLITNAIIEAGSRT